MHVPLFLSLSGSLVEHHIKHTLPPRVPDPLSPLPAVLDETTKRYTADGFLEGGARERGKR